MKKFLLLMVAVIMANIAAAQIYDRVGYYYDGLALVEGYTSANGWSKKYGYVNQYNKLVIPLKYEGAGNFCEGIAAVQIGLKYGYINTKGAAVTPLIYDEINDFDSGFGIVGQRNKGWGCVNKSGKVILPCKYGSINVVHAKLVNGDKTKIGVVKADGNYYNQNGTNITPAGCAACGAAYTNNDCDKTMLLIWKGEKMGGIDKNGKIIIPAEYDCVENLTCANKLLKLEKNKKYGLVDYDGKIILPVECEKIDFIWKKECFYAEKDGVMGMVDRTGKVIIPFNFKFRFNYDQFDGKNVKKYKIVTDSTGKWGIIDEKWDIKLKLVYDSISKVDYKNSDFLLLKKDNKYGILSTEFIDGNKTVFDQPDKLDNLELLFDDIEVKNNGIFFTIDGKVGYCRYLAYFDFLTQTPTIKCICDDLEVTDNLYFVKLDGLWGVARYDFGFTTDCSSLMKPVEVEEGVMLDDNGKVGIIDKYKGDVVIPFEYEISEPSEGMIKVKKGDFYTFVSESYEFGKKRDKSNDYFAQYKDKFVNDYFYFEEAHDFHDGVAAVKVKGKWGYISKGLSWVVKPKFAEAGDFNKGKALVKSGSKEYYIGKDGKKIK